MHALRRSTWLLRLVLAWFVLAITAAVAAPMVNPRPLELVCSADGKAKLVSVADAEQGVAPAHTVLECPMCLPTSPPQPPHQPRAAPTQPLAHVLQPIAAAHIAALVGAPLPPRGPPLN